MLAQELTRRAPADAEWVHELAWACQNMASVLLLSGSFDAALPWAERTLTLRDEAAQRQPGNAHFRHQRASARLTLALALSLAGQHTRSLAMHEEGAAITRASAAADPANKTAARDLLLSELAKARVLAQAGQAPRAVEVLEHLLVELAAPAAAGGSDSGADRGADFYMARVRAEALIWQARVLPPGRAARALELAGVARAQMTDRSGGERKTNAPRDWALALAAGEQAAALAALGRTAEARAAAREALDLWRAAPGGAAPGLYARWQARDRLLAGAR